jgi:hypothetical protein
MEDLHIDLFNINLKHYVSVSCFFIPPYHHNFVPIPYWNHDFKTFEFEKIKIKILRPF